MSLSGYAVARHINQLPATHRRSSITSGTPTSSTRETTSSFTGPCSISGAGCSTRRFATRSRCGVVLSTNQTTLYGSRGLPVRQKFNAYAGINDHRRHAVRSWARTRSGSPTTASLPTNSSAPASPEPSWVNGELTPGFWYQVAAGDSLSQLGFTAKQLTRDIATGVQVM